MDCSYHRPFVPFLYFVVIVNFSSICGSNVVAAVELSCIVSESREYVRIVDGTDSLLIERVIRKSGLCNVQFENSP